MGCSCSREEARVIYNKQLQNSKNVYLIKIHLPESDNTKVIVYEGKMDNMLLSRCY